MTKEQIKQKYQKNAEEWGKSMLWVAQFWAPLFLRKAHISGKLEDYETYNNSNLVKREIIEEEGYIA